MFRKTMLSLFLITVLSVSSVYAYGIGLQLDGDSSANGIIYGPAITFKLDDIPVYFAVNLRIADSRTTFGITGDWWQMNERIEAIPYVRWFWGFGFYGMTSFGDPAALAIGGRIPVGINAYFGDGFFEPFLQIAPSLGIILLPDVEFPDWFIPVSLGFRFWFK